MSKAKWQINAEKYAAYRDASMAEVEKYFPSPSDSKHLAELPDPLPLNVIPLKKDFLSPSDLEIVETDPIELLAQIKNKKISAVKVAGAYLRTAILAQRLINNVTEFLPKEAFEQASYLDKYLEEQGKVVGPLHGLPISLKDHIALKDKRNTFMLTSLVDNVLSYNSAIVDILRDAGSVFYQRTTQPQFLMHLESNSMIHGITGNPYNTTLTCGGSSGGEGAAVGFGSSCVGMGTDIGGSVRCPASLQGVYGMKGSVGRMPVDDVYKPGAAGAESILPTLGPIARTLEICELVYKVVIDSKPWLKRPELVTKPWMPEDVLKDKKKLRIGILHSDDIATPQPPVARALREVEEKLKSGTTNGIELEVVPFKPFDHERALKIAMSLYFEDGGKEMLALLEETEEPLMELSKAAITENPYATELDLKGLWELNAQKHAYRDEYNRYWNEQGIDMLICPVGPGPAQPHGTSLYCGYTSQWNLLDYPGITFPVTFVDAEKDAGYPEGYKPLNIFDKELFEKYTPETYAGAPVALQLVTRRLHEEETFEYMKIVEQVLAQK